MGMLIATNKTGLPPEKAATYALHTEISHQNIESSNIYFI
jgi:hypothetical protein